MVAIANSFMSVLGDKDGQAGFYGAIRKFFHDFTGGYQASGDIVDLLRIVYEYSKMNPVHKGDLVNLT